MTLAIPQGWTPMGTTAKGRKETGHLPMANTDKVCPKITKKTLKYPTQTNAYFIFASQSERQGLGNFHK